MEERAGRQKLPPFYYIYLQPYGKSSQENGPCLPSRTAPG